MSSDRLTMPIGEVMFTQRSVRKFRPDPIPVEDLRLILEAAVKAPNGANRQIGRFLVVNDREKIREFGRLYHEAWWAKRRDERGLDAAGGHPARGEELPVRHGARGRDQGRAVHRLRVHDGPGRGQLGDPACQNLMLAAHALGIGSIPTTLHPQVMDRFHAMFGIPKDMTFHFCIPLGYPAVKYGPSRRKPVSETTSWNHWAGAVPWA